MNAQQQSLSFPASQKRREQMTFEDWAKANPHIIKGVFDLADEFRGAGFQRWSAWAAVNVLRWQTALRDRTQTEYKISNNEIADIARLYNRERNVPFFVTHRRKDGSL